MGNGDGDGTATTGLSLPVLACKCAASGLTLLVLFMDGLLNELGVRAPPPDETRFKLGREIGPLIVLAPSPNPTRLALASSLTLLALSLSLSLSLSTILEALAPSSMVSSLALLSASSPKASLPLAQVVRLSPILPVALALPTVLRSLWLCWLSK